MTGASTGIGRATAIKLAEQGAFLVLSATNQVKLDQTKQECLGRKRVTRTDHNVDQHSHSPWSIECNRNFQRTVGRERCDGGRLRFSGYWKTHNSLWSNSKSFWTTGRFDQQCGYFRIQPSDGSMFRRHRKADTNQLFGQRSSRSDGFSWLGSKSTKGTNRGDQFDGRLLWISAQFSVLSYQKRRQRTSSLNPRLSSVSFHSFSLFSLFCRHSTMWWEWSCFIVIFQSRWFVRVRCAPSFSGVRSPATDPPSIWAVGTLCLEPWRPNDVQDCFWWPEPTDLPKCWLPNNHNCWASLWHNWPTIGFSTCSNGAIPNQWPTLFNDVLLIAKFDLKKNQTAKIKT